MAFAMNRPRVVVSELLDALVPSDPRAQRSRADLRRIHRAMASLTIMRAALRRATRDWQPQTLLEIGAGDGSLMLRLGECQAQAWPQISVTLVDRLDVVEPHTLDGLRRLGWHPQALTADVFDWLATAEGGPWDVICANLFLHHFARSELARLLAAVAARTRVFFCCEPRRAPLALLGSHLLGLLGAGAVTRFDAVASVHAGFQAKELTALWPVAGGWHVEEYPAGLFSHAFLAVRTAP